MQVAPVDDEVALETVDPTPVRAPERLVRRMRASFCVLGPLLARRGRAIVPLPGGCNIGHRPVDLHLKGLAALGADLRLEHGYVVATARRLTGATIDLSGPHGPTVTGTANVLCAAVLARGDNDHSRRGQSSRKSSIWAISSLPWARRSKDWERRRSASRASINSAAPRIA